MDREQSRLAYLSGGVVDPLQLFVRDLKTGEDRQLTQLNQDLLNEIDLGQMEEVWFERT